MEEFTTRELTDEEIANANTVIIVDSEGTQPTDSVNDANILDDGVVGTRKISGSFERKSDSQSTYLSNDSVANNADENVSFSLSDMSEELNSINNFHSQEQNELNDDNVVVATDCCATVGGSEDSPIDDRRFPSGLPRLSSTPLLRVSSDRSNVKEKGNSLKKGGAGDRSECVSRSPSRRRRRKLSKNSDEVVSPNKRFKNLDDSQQMNLTDERAEHEIQEHTFALIGSATLLIDKSTNRIYAARLKQLSLAEEFEESSSGAAIIPPDVDCALKRRLSMGSGSDSSGNLADRSFTGSSGVSIPGPFELPAPHFRRTKKEGANSSNPRDSLTSTSSSLTSNGRQNGLRYLDIWYSRHHLNEHQSHNSILKLFHTQHIQLSCPDCNHVFPPLEVPSASEYPAVHSNVTPEVSTTISDGKRQNSNASAERKTQLMDQELDCEDHSLKSKLTSVINKIDGNKGHDLSPFTVHKTAVLSTSSGSSLEKVAMKQTQMMQAKDVSKLESKMKSISNDEMADSHSSKSLPVNVFTNSDDYEFKAQPCSSGQSRKRVFINLKTDSSDNSTNSISESDVLPESDFFVPFLDVEDVMPLAEGNKGKTSSSHRIKRTRALPPVEEDATILLSDGSLISYPPTHSRLFENCNFLFTYSQTNWKKNRKSHDSEEDSSSNELSQEYYIMDSSKLIDVVKTGGGNVYKSLAGVPLSEWNRTYLIANHPCRTVKYLQCLAAGIARYSQLCIIQCCVEKKPFPNLLGNHVDQLPSGWSEELQRVIKCQDCQDPLKGHIVYLALTKSYHSSREIEFWEGLLRNMAANVIRHKITQGGYHLNSVSIIVTDSNCSDQLIEEASLLLKPVVNCNWIVHTLIHGKYCEPVASPVYKYSYVPEY